MYAGVVLSLFPLPSLSAAGCNASIYGSPEPLDCSRILLDDPTIGSHGLESADKFQKSHLFYGRAFDQRPDGVSISQWVSRVQLAGVIHSRGWSNLGAFRRCVELTEVQNRAL